MTPGLPSNFANAVAPFVPMGRPPVGQENEDLRGTTLKPLEQSAESARGENFRAPDQRAGETDERWRLEREGRDTREGRQESTPADGEGADRPGGGEAATTVSSRGRAALADEQIGRADEARDRAPASEGETRQSEQRRESLQEREIVRELAARDREVRQHERAHAALGGRYAGAPRYEYERGPDGVTYAVSGEVPIDTSKIPNDPEATLEKAQQIRRAAFAPAEPSQADRRVAAEAAQLEAEARAELRRERLEAMEQSRGGADESGDEPSAIDARGQEREAREQSEREQDRDERLDALNEEQRRRNIGTYLELIELGGLAPGRQLDQRA